VVRKEISSDESKKRVCAHRRKAQGRGEERNTSIYKQQVPRSSGFALKVKKGEGGGKGRCWEGKKGKGESFGLY